MAAPFAPYALDDLGGGLNDGLPATHIANNQSASLFNWIPIGTKLQRRRGVSQYTATPHTENLTSGFSFKDSTGIVYLILGALTGLARLDNQGVTKLTGTALGSSDLPWDFHEYKSVGYALRPDAGLQRFKSDFYQAAGIAALSAAATLADAGGGGLIEAGTYYYVVTRYNSATGVESNPSPTSVSITIAASHKITATWADAGSGQWDAYRIYRTLPNQAPNAFFFVDQVSKNTLTYTDNIPLSNLGRSVSFDNGLPPSGIGQGALWRERMFAHNGKSVYFSEEGLVECFAADSIINVFPEDLHEIRSLTPFGDRLLIGKTNAMHFLVPAGVRKFGLQTLSDRHGCYSHWSVKTAEGIAIWYSGTDFIRSDGTNVVPISTIKIRHLLDRVPDARKKYIVAELDPANNLYMATLPLDGSTNNRAVVVYNYKTDAWTVFDHWDAAGVTQLDAPSYLIAGVDANYGLSLYATFYSGHVYQYLTGTADFGNPIRARGLTKQFSKKGPMVSVLRANVLVQSVAENLQLSIYRDSSSTAEKTRTLSLNQAADWKVYNVNTIGRPASTIQLGYEYDGVTQIELESIALDVLETARPMRAA